MTSEVIYRPGAFVWRELMTTDVDASTRFYGEVFGWKAAPLPDGSYTVLNAGEVGVGGMMKVPMPGIPAYWTGYVSVADVDAKAPQIVAAGGAVLAGPMDAGEFGRFVACSDPQGGMISAWRSAMGDGPVPQPGLGHFCWEQLNTPDPAGAFPFYAAIFGWTKKPFPGGGPMEVLCAGTTEVASLMQAPPGAPAHWLSYVVVDELVAAEARVTRGGGKVLVERIDVPGVGAIGVIQDNVGAVIGIFEQPHAG